MATRKISYRDAVNEALVQEMERDPAVMAELAQSRLRRKIGHDRVVTVRGLGYRLSV